MVKKLVVHNHAYLLPHLAKSYDVIHYAPTYESDVQENFFLKNFHEIQNVYPDIIWGDADEKTPGTDYLAWQAYEEKYSCGDQLLPHRNRLFESLPFEIPESFTAFRKKCEPLLPLWYESAQNPYTKTVIDELDYYFRKEKLASTYFDTRNGLVGRDFSTKFSHFLSSGMLDVRFLYNEVKKYEELNGENKSTYWIIFELLWREFYFHHYQKWETSYFSENGLKGKNVFCEVKKYEMEELKKISPNNFFTAALIELERTGFQSNRVRQIFASIWLNDLELNWRSGAELFERYLIDYDVFSNYGNWMYLAGVGVDPRGKRYFKLSKQLNQYDPQGEYIKKWLAVH